ncbi:hypothetical protein ACSBR2_020074 [Camellia fascicularis]
MSYNQLLVNLILVLLIKHRDQQTKKNPYGKNKADNQIELKYSMEMHAHLYTGKGHEETHQYRPR